MTASVFESIEEVGSSRSRIGASLRKARATEIRWRSPPEQLGPALADHRLVLLGEADDEIVGVGRLGSGDDLVHGRLEPAVADIVGDGVGEQQRLLLDEADALAKRLE